MNKSLLTILFLAFTVQLAFTQHQEIKYNKASDDIPFWAQIMYGEDPNIQAVMEAYDDYYKDNEFVKNQDTQYYKHWLRNISRDHNGLFLPSSDLDIKEIKKNEKEYIERSKESKSRRSPSSQWQGIGPFDYDHDAAGRSYAPGAAHVYTIEQAKSNHNTLYAGTATAGLYKSVDYGLNWTLMSKDLLIGGIRSIEIDHSDEDIIYFGASGLIYKSIDGGVTWSPTGDSNFQNTGISVNDLVMHPSNSNELFVCADQGLFQTTDAGNNWTLIRSGVHQELEFQPGNSNTIYTIESVVDHTEFYKSIDGGATWNLKSNGWPVIAGSTSANNFEAIQIGNNTNDYVEFASNPELGSSSPDFTIEIRIKTNGWSSDPPIFSNKNWGNGNNKGFVIAGNTNGSTWKFNIGDGSNRIDINGGAINDNEWHNIVISYDADGEKAIYQDGSLINTSTANISSNTISGLALALMQDGTLSYSSALGAEVSELRIWEKALSKNSIQDFGCRSVNGNHPDFNSLLHYWKVDEGSGTMLNDSSGSNTGTVNNSPTWTSGNIMNCLSTNLVAGENQRRTEFSVTDAAPNTIYALAAGSVNGGSGLVGVYKSIDAGENWSLECCGAGEGGAASVTNPNMLGYAKDGSSNGGQFYYDLTCAASPTNADEFHIAGIQRWFSTDGGTSFTCPAKWSEPGNAAYIHADIHDMHFFANGDIWAAGDGGIYHSSDGGATFEDRMFGIEGTDFWGFGAGFIDGQVMLGGTYHNSTLLKDNNVYENGWISTAKGGAGGDNYRGFVNPGKERQVYLDAGKRVLSGDRSIGFMDSNLCKEPNATYTIGASSRLEFHPTNYNEIYYGEGTSLWLTQDDGANCIQVYDFGESVTAVSIAWSNPEVMYVATWGSFWGTNKKIWKTVDAGITWNEITPIASWIAWDIAVDPQNENNLWAARVSQYAGTPANGEMIYQSTDGGSNWTNITTSDLDGEFLTNIIHQHGTDGGVYIGTRRSVYYKNNSMSNWSLFNAGLPVRTFSTRLIPYYFGGKLRNGTDRSVYEVDFYESSTPIAQISADKKESFCSRDTFYFVDHSNLNSNGATWNWSFTGAEYVSSTTDRAPKVVFGSAGTFDVSLTVTDANGTDTQTLNDFVTVLSDECNVDTIPGKSFYINSAGYANAGRPAALDFNNTKPFTMAAWVKLNNANSTGYILTKYDRFVVGQYQFGIENGNVIGHRETPPWQATGATSLLPNQWYYLTATYDGSQMKVFVDGVEDGVVNMTGSIGSIGKDVLIGARHRSGDVNDNFDGEIEELAVWNRALSQQEIRILRHLTLDPDSDNSLVAYYQFNESAGPVFDKAGASHASVEEDATRNTSTCPVGGGTSDLLNVTSGGVYQFVTSGIEIDFASSGFPNGEVVGFRLNTLPDVTPNNATIPDTGYWIINNYGLEQTFSELNSIQFNNVSINNSDAANFGNLKLYKRSSNEDLGDWGNSLDEADVAVYDSSITFNNGNSITSFSQFLIQKENCPSNLVLNVNPIDGDTLRASVLISSNGTVSNSDIAFLAGNCIELDNGFEVTNGAQFIAEIENCMSTTNISVNEVKSPNETPDISFELIDKKNKYQLNYELPRKGKVSIALQSLNGKQLVRPLRNRFQSQGKQSISLLKEQFNSGLYYLIIESENKVIAKKVIALK